MKSIKQQYIDLKEGKMSQQNFMRNLRMTMPQYVTNVTSYGDAVKILKNKGILNETLIKQLDKAGLEEDYDDYMDYRDEEEAEAKEDERIDNMINQKLEDEYEEKMRQSLAAADAAIEKAEEEESGKYTTGMDQFPIREAKYKWENTSGKSMYAQFKEIDNLNGQEVLIGIDYEIEHNHELSKTEAIKLVIKNLKKNPIYYTATLMAGKEMLEIPTIGKLKPGSDKMRELKGEDSLVDKDNGMKPVKDVEKVKASANKAKKETNKPEGTISLMSLVAKASRGVQKMNATGEKMKVVKENLEMQGDFKVGDKVMVNPNFPEAADATRLKMGEIYTITNFRIYKKGSLLQNVDALLDNEEEINIDYLIKAPSSVPSSIFSKNAGISQKLKSLSADDLMEIIREELSEYFDGRDNLTDTAGRQLDELSSQEQAVVDDIIGTLDEGMFSNVLDKIKSYAKKGLLTAAIVASLLSAPQFTQAQQQQIQQIAQTEMSATQTKNPYENISKLQSLTSQTNPFKINMKGDSYGGESAKGQSLNWGLNAGKKGTFGLSVEQSPNSSKLKVIVTKGDKSENFNNVIDQLKTIKGVKITNKGAGLVFQAEVDASSLNELASLINNNF
jgi:hypothetical protein